MPNHRNLLIAVLAVVHVIGVPIYAWVAGDDLGRLLVASGFWASQTSLLGLWGAMATCSWKIRLPVVMIGIAHISLLPCLFAASPALQDLRLRFLPINALMHCASVASVAIPFAVVRWFLARLERVENHAASGPLQFSIRHLLLLTFLIGCAIGMEPWLRELLFQMESWMTPISRWGRWLSVIPRWGRSLGVSPELLRLCLWSVPVALSAVWATLGRRHVMLRSVAFFGVGLPTAFLVANVYGSSPLMPSSVHAVSMIPEAFVVFASLGVVRLAGFRMVRVSSGESRPAPGRTRSR